MISTIGPGIGLGIAAKPAGKAKSGEDAEKAAKAQAKADTAQARSFLQSGQIDKDAFNEVRERIDERLEAVMDRDDDDDDDNDDDNVTMGPGNGINGASWVPPGLRDKLGSLPENNPWHQSTNGKQEGGQEREPSNRADGGSPSAPQPNLFGNISAQQTQALNQDQGLLQQQIQPFSGAPTQPSNDPTRIVDASVLNNLAAGNTAGFISSLGGNVQRSLRHSEGLFFQITG